MAAIIRPGGRRRLALATGGESVYNQVLPREGPIRRKTQEGRMPKAQPRPPEELSYEEAFEELQSIVERLESGELPLEESLALFERGQALAARCNELLEKAELKLRALAPDESGEFVETDFEEPAE